MKSEFVDVNDTRKQVHVEIASEVVDAHIDQVARDYSRKARIPGFRPGKAPARVIKQRFRDQILHDVAHSLIPQAVDDALRERGVEAVDTPDIRDVTVEEGRALTFTASFDTLPAFDPGDYGGILLRRPSTAIDEEAVDRALERLRERAGRFEPVEGRNVTDGDTVSVNLLRGAEEIAGSKNGPAPRALDIELGSKANPPGFDEHLLDLGPGATKDFTIHYPDDYAIRELAGSDVPYRVTLNAIKRRVLPALDDEFAKDVGNFDTLAALRARVREDLEHEAKHAAERDVRAELKKQLAARLPFEVPPSLVEREVDRRIEDFARRLAEQNIDPRNAGIDWSAFREAQRGVAREGVASAVVLDEIARREKLEVAEGDIQQEIDRYAEASSRSAAAVRAALEKEGGLSRIAAGLRQEKSIDFVMARATIAGE